MDFTKIRAFISDHLVFTVALLLALVSLPFAQPGTDVLGYVDVKTIACLFCILASVGVLAGAGAFDAVARLLTRTFSSARVAILILVGTTLVLSMFITNDMALVVMLPLAALVLSQGGWIKLLPFCFIMQNLAANLGGMILPFGNPQNLYLYEHYNIEFDAFLQVMFMPFVVSVALILVCCIVVPRNTSAGAHSDEAGTTSMRTGSDMPLHKRRVLLGITLFVLTVLAVFRVFPYWIALIVVVVALLAFDRFTLRNMDWFLLLTFACFFVFAGVVSNIPVLQALLTEGMNMAPLLVSAGCSQVISNVPAAVLLSQVTEVWQPLLIGVNIGGAGTLVASLASLITIGRYRTVRISNAQTGVALPSSKHFAVRLMAYGFAFLIVLIFICGL